MVVQCLKSSLTTPALACLEPYQAQFTFDGIKYATLMYKIVIRLATINSVATTESLFNNLDNLPFYPASVNGNADMINSYFDANYSQILACGATVDDPLLKLVDGYLAVPDNAFKKYILSKQEHYHDSKLGATYTYKNLMAQASATFSLLKIKGVWDAKSPEEERLVTLLAELRGKFNLAPELSTKKPDDKKDGQSKKAGGDNKKVKNKKKTSNKKQQKQEKSWKKVPPKDNKPKEKIIHDKTYHWCEHHMAWGMHSSKTCHSGAQRKDKKDNKPNSVAAAATVATITCPSIASHILSFLFKDCQMLQ
jgi:hypothetical protein